VKGQCGLDPDTRGRFSEVALMSLPTVAEVLRWLDELSASGYSPETRHRASQWATPILVGADTPLITDPPALSEALFLLGAADLMTDLGTNYLYGPADFAQARGELSMRQAGE